MSQQNYTTRARGLYHSNYILALFSIMQLVAYTHKKTYLGMTK